MFTGCEAGHELEYIRRNLAMRRGAWQINALCYPLCCQEEGLCLRYVQGGVCQAVSLSVVQSRRDQRSSQSAGAVWTEVTRIEDVLCGTALDVKYDSQ